MRPLHLLRGARFENPVIADSRGTAHLLVRVSLIADTDGVADLIRQGLGLDGCAIWTRYGDQMQLLDSSGEVHPMATSPSGAPAVGVTTSTMLSLEHGGEIVGRLALRRDAGLPLADAAWFDHVQSLCARLSQEVVWRIRNERLTHEHERMRQTAMIDDITGAWNRTSFVRNVSIAISAARRRGEVISLVRFDLIGLAQINVRYGHAVGDAALAQLAGTIRANVRASDELGRISGDEIVVLLPNAPGDAATEVARNLVERISLRPLLVDGVSLQLNVRVGVTPIGPNETTADLALARAAFAVASHDGAINSVAFTDCDTMVSDEYGLYGITADEDPLTGVVLGGMYRVIHELSHGATGVVYRGEDLVLGRQVAIKVLRSNLAHDPVRVARFRSEASALAAIRHPNLVGVHTAGIEGDRVYFVMELIEGSTLWDVLRHNDPDVGNAELSAITVVVREVADALDALHGSGLIHRDVKPENVVLDRINARAVLVDVGTAKRYGDRQQGAGTPGFSAPESFAGEPETFAADVYGLAATAYTLLAGVPPFGYAEPYVLLARQIEGLPVPPSHHRPELSSSIDEVVLRGMAPDPRERYRSPSAFAVALDAALARMLQPRRNTGDLSPETVAKLPPGFVTVEEPLTDDPCGKLRGTAVRIALQTIGVRRGEWWLRRLAQSNKEFAALMDIDLDPMSWQSASLLARFIEQAGGDSVELGRLVGLGMTSSTFNNFWGPAAQGTTPEMALAKLAGFWNQYFSAGTFALVDSSPCHATIIITGPPSVPVLRGIVIGTLQRIAELSSGDRVTVVSVHVTGACWQFSMQWRNLL